MPHVERDGVEIFYESFGQGTPIVFLHPLSLNRYAWVHQMFAFARTHRVVVVDHRGHGLSGKPPGGHSIREMGLDGRAVLDHAEIDKAILIGNSAGSMVAVQTALDAPERVLAMMLVSCATNLAPSVPGEVLRAYDARFEAAFDYMIQGSISATTRRERPEIAESRTTRSRAPPATPVPCRRERGTLIRRRNTRWNARCWAGDS
jgi:pimeloyl-ACP methyl ester carboxylesterase